MRFFVIVQNGDMRQFSSLALGFLLGAPSGRRAGTVFGCGPRLRSRRQAKDAAQNLNRVEKVPSGLLNRRTLQGIRVSYGKVNLLLLCRGFHGRGGKDPQIGVVQRGTRNHAEAGIHFRVQAE